MKNYFSDSAELGKAPPVDSYHKGEIIFQVTAPVPTRVRAAVSISSIDFPAL